MALKIDSELLDFHLVAEGSISRRFSLTDVSLSASHCIAAHIARECCVILSKDNFPGIARVDQCAFHTAGYGPSSVPKDGRHAAGRETESSHSAHPRSVSSEYRAGLVQKGRRTKMTTMKPYFSNLVANTSPWILLKCGF